MDFRPRRRPFLLTAVLAALALALTPGAALAAGCPPSTIEAEIAKEINRKREANGRAKYRYDPQLGKVAALHAAKLRRKQKLVHTPIKVLRKRITKSTYIGENLGRLGKATSMKPKQRAKKIVAMWMNSKVHRANILRSTKKFKHQGLGVFYRDGTMWVAHNFAGPQDPGTTVTNKVC